MAHTDTTRPATHTDTTIAFTNIEISFTNSTGPDTHTDITIAHTDTGILHTDTTSPASHTDIGPACACVDGGCDSDCQCPTTLCFGQDISTCYSPCS